MVGPYPLATVAATIDATGISAPAYSDILSSFQASVGAIYGSDLYLQDDSQDGEFLALLALAQQDVNDTAIDTYNAYSPSFAQGAGLSSIVKTNGLAREASSNSTVVLTLTGQAYTPVSIANGVVLVGDDQGLGTQWAVPPTTIPASGSIEVTATCVTQGAVTAGSGTLTNILTPLPAFQSVTNASSAAPGLPVEKDPQLRQRQAASTALPAQTPLNSILAAVLNVTAIGRADSYENDTTETDANGLPPGSIAIVAEGGTASAIAQAIALKKAPGVPTYGTTSVVVVDQYGVPNTINFFEMTEVDVSFLIYLTPLSNYVSTTGSLAVAAVAQYLATLPIGVSAYLDKLLAAANLSGTAALVAAATVMGVASVTQTQLDALSATYTIAVSALYQARDDMVVTGGPYAAGTETIDMGNAVDLSAGQLMAITLDNSTLLQATLSALSGDAITFSPVIPEGRTVVTGALVYVNGDLGIAFDEGAQSAIADGQVFT